MRLTNLTTLLSAPDGNARIIPKGFYGARPYVVPNLVYRTSGHSVDTTLSNSTLCLYARMVFVVLRPKP